LQHTPSAQLPDLQSTFFSQAEPFATDLVHFSIGLQLTSHPPIEAIPSHDGVLDSAVQLF
jgi:hypothetical protein